MTEVLTTQNISFAVFIIGILLTVYNSIRNPQIKSEKNDIIISDRMAAVEKAVLDIRETHIRSVEHDIKLLNATINALSLNMTKLSTIIDERIPKQKN